MHLQTRRKDEYYIYRKQNREKQNQNIKNNQKVLVSQVELFVWKRQ